MFARSTDPYEFAAIEGNLRETLKFFSLGNDGGCLAESADLLMISSGINYGVFNTVLLKTLVASEAQLIDAILRGRDFFSPRGERWSFWVCHDLLIPQLQRRLRRIMESNGLRFLSEPPGLIAHRLLPPRRFLPGLDIEPVLTAPTRAAFAGILSTTFDLPHGICRDVYGPERSWRGGYRGWIGSVGGEPIVSTACVVAAGVAGIYSVGTMPNWRRRGYAEQLMRQVLETIRLETGIEQTILQSTPEGIRVYQRMGYRRATQFSIYLTEPA